MDGTLLFRQRYKKVLIYPFRKLLQDFIFFSPYQDMLKGIPDGLKVLITYHLSPSIHYRVVMDKTV